MNQVLETVLATEQPEKINFWVEGANFKCKIPWQEIYDDFKQNELIEDLSARALNFLFFNSSNEKLELEILDGSDIPKLGIVLFLYVKDKNKGFLVNTAKILCNYCSKMELGKNYQKLLNEILSKEES